MELQAA